MAVKSRVLWAMAIFLLLTGALVGVVWADPPSPSASPAAATPPVAPARSAVSPYVLLSWNDLGMHCYNGDFSNLAVLPPYNTLWAQVVRRGDPPQIVTEGVSVTYSFPDNTYSVWDHIGAAKTDKSNFWQYAQQLFGLSAPLPANIGLTGKSLAGEMDKTTGTYFKAEGIPLTEYRDQDVTGSQPWPRYPFQLATVSVIDKNTKQLLTSNTIVAPVSTEMRCDRCHSDTGDATVNNGVTPTGKVETNILALHDQLSQAQYPAGHTGALMTRQPILCAECHSSNALKAAGQPGVESLSNAMHKRHSDVPDITPDTAGCYNCHPGPTTQCLRDVMSQEEGMTCINCHGNLQHVSQNANPWLSEPRCDGQGCHAGSVRQDQALYRFSRGHGGLYCEACHDSTHAIARSRETNDQIKFINLQGDAGTLQQCTVCHLTQPAGDFRHTFIRHHYLPGIVRN